jgi:hypothetical protein
MAFDLTKINKVSSGANSLCYNIFSYDAGDDDRTDIETDGYFNEANDSVTRTGRFKTGDWLCVKMSAGEGETEDAVYKITQLSPDITVEQIDLSTPPQYVSQLIKVGAFTPNSDGTPQTVNITGILTTDRPIVMLNQSDQVISVSCRIASNGVLSVFYSGALGSGTRSATYFIFRDL